MRAIPHYLLAAALLFATSRLHASAPALAPLAAYDYGQPLAPLIDYENRLHAATPAERAAVGDELLALLDAPGATTAAKRVFIDWLGVAGTGKCAPALARLAANPDYTFNAARSLAAIPGEEAEKALVGLLDHDSNTVRIAAANALGQRRAESAIPSLARLLAPGSQVAADVRAAALDALAQIGTTAAVRALQPLRDSRPFGPEDLPRVRALAAAAANTVRHAPPAEKNAAQEYAKKILLADLHGATAEIKVEIVNTLFTPAPAAPGCNLMGYNPDAADLRPLLAAPEPRLRAAVARGLAASSDPAAVEILRDQFPSLPPDTQLAALNAVASSRNATALPIIETALAADSPALREAAIHAAGACGAGSQLAALVRALGDSENALAAAAQTALQRFPSETASAFLLNQLTTTATGDNTLRIRLLDVLAARQERAVFAQSAAWTSDSDAPLRAAAFATVARLVRPGDLSAVLSLAANIKAGADHREWTRALFDSVALEPDAASAARLLSAQLARSGARERAALIGALTLVNAPGASDTLQSLLAAPDTAVRKETIRALSAAQTPDACKLLLATARNGLAADERTLSLIGAIATLERLDIPAAAKVGEYRAAWSLASRDEERQSIIAAVKKIRAPAAASFLKEIIPADK
ncbi:HEAT repeat domain-containing protein [Termitidicoccus mucosus]|uniref:HEAT repeat domain-containing protein n=1 Tax=Termitidicoccus mucosus TaxID=1184151 RepID=A0A178IF27_9BACT|nr:hypothetical protein AW736_21060 [Opitutaceae bacterium TSB47]